MILFKISIYEKNNQNEINNNDDDDHDDDIKNNSILSCHSCIFNSFNPRMYNVKNDQTYF